MKKEDEGGNNSDPSLSLSLKGERRVEREREKSVAASINI